MQGVRLSCEVSLHESGVVGVEECHVVPAVEDKRLLRLPGLPHRRPEVVEDKRLLGLPGLPHRRPEVVEDKRLLGLPGLPHRRPEVVVERSESADNAVVSTEGAKQVVDHGAYRKQLMDILLIQ